jgi:hypothetical protein
LRKRRKKSSFSGNFHRQKIEIKMVNFNFGLGASNTQGATGTTTSSDDTTIPSSVTIPSDSTPAPMEEAQPSIVAAKPLTELLSQESNSEENSALPQIESDEIIFDETTPDTDENSGKALFEKEENIPNVPSEESSSTNPFALPNQEIASEEPEETEETESEELEDSETVVKENSIDSTPVQIPTNPFATSNTEVSHNEDSVAKTTETVAVPEVSSSENNTDTTSVKMPSSNSFATPSVNTDEIKETKNDTPVVAPENNVDSTPIKAPINPFATLKQPTIEIKKEINEERVLPSTNPFSIPTISPKKEGNDNSSVKVSTDIFVPQKNIVIETSKEESHPATEENNTSSSMQDDTANSSTTDPMQAVKQVKSDIVAFVDFHKKNIQNFQQDISKLEKKIQEEKRLLREKGNAYTNVLKELQDLTQNFGDTAPQRGEKHKNREFQPKTHSDNRK